MLSEISHSKRTTAYMRYLEESQLIETENRMVISRGWEEGGIES